MNCENLKSIENNNFADNALPILMIFALGFFQTIFNVFNLSTMEENFDGESNSNITINTSVSTASAAPLT